MLQFIIFLFLVRFCKAFGPPGHIPPNDFMAENWYPKNLPTVQPPWKHDMDNKEGNSKATALPTPPSPPGPTVVMGVTRSPLTTLSTIAATSTTPSTSNTSFTILTTTSSLSTTTSISNSTSLSTITHQLTSTSASTLAVTPNTTQSTSLSTEIPTNSSSTTPTANSIITSEIDFTTMLPLSNSTNKTLAALITTESANSSSGIVLTTTLSTSARPKTMKSTTDMITTQKTQNLSSSIATTTTPRPAIIPIPIQLSPFFEDITANLEPKRAEKGDINQIDKAVDSGENELDKSTAPIIISKSTSTKLTTEATTSTKLILSKTTSTPDKHNENSSPNSVNENEIVDITKQSEISINFKPIINNGFILKSDGRALVDNSQTFKLECPDLLFIVDSSGNALNQFEKQKDLVKSIMLALGVESRRYGLMTYAGKKRQRMNAVTTSFTKFLSKLKNTKFISGITATGAALERAATILHVRKHSTQVIVVTDGFSFDEVDIPAEILRSVPRVEVYVTGDYQPVVNTVLESIAGIDDNVFLGPNSIRDIARTVRCN